MRESIPLTAFEEFMLHKNSSAYPASCFLKLNFSGRLQQDAFSKAVNRTIARHPLLHATVKKDRAHSWQIGDVQPEIQWRDTKDLLAPECQQLDLNAQHGLSFFVQRTADASEVLIQFHHSCCDGISIYHVVRDLMIAYASEGLEDPTLQPPPIDETLLKGRGALGLRAAPRLKLITRQAARVPAAFNFFARTPASLAPLQPRSLADSTSTPYPALFAHHFDKTTSSAVKRKTPTGFTLNDVLIRDLFLALRNFLHLQRRGNDADWLRLMIPTNLRRKEQFRASAANIIGAVFLDRRGIGMRNPDDMLLSIHREMDRIKRLNLGHLFNFALVAQRWLPGGLRRPAQQHRCAASAVFTNIGRVLTRSPLPQTDGRLECGDVTLESTEVAAPIASNISSAFSATWYANRLSITLHVDPRVISAPEARSLLELFVNRISASAGLQPPTDPQRSPEKTDAMTTT